MVLVRGIKGDLKLNPDIKLWGGLTLLLAGTGYAVYDQIGKYREDVATCEASGGVWIGGVPMRVGTARTLAARCEGVGDRNASD